MKLLFVSLNVNRKALKSLQGLGGVYGLVVPCDEVQFPGALVGYFTGGEPLRVVLPKATKVCRKQRVRTAASCPAMMLMDPPVRDMVCN